MTSLRWCTVLMASAVALSSAVASAEGGSVLDFLKSRRDRRYAQVPHKVLAFYYTWYGRPERHGGWLHWGSVKPEDHDISMSRHYPAKGAYDSQDPAIIDYHIDLDAHGRRAGCRQAVPRPLPAGMRMTGRCPWQRSNVR